MDARQSPALGTRAGDAGRAAERLGRSRACRRRPAHRGGRGAAHPCARRRGDRRADGRASAGARSLPARPPVSHRHGLQPSRRAARGRARVAQRPVPLHTGRRPLRRSRHDRRQGAGARGAVRRPVRDGAGHARQRAVPLGAGGGDRVAALRADHPPPSPALRHRCGDRLGHDLGVAPTTRGAGGTARVAGIPPHAPHGDDRSAFRHHRRRRPQPGGRAGRADRGDARRAHRPGEDPRLLPRRGAAVASRARGSPAERASPSRASSATTAFARCEPTTRWT